MKEVHILPQMYEVGEDLGIGSLVFNTQLASNTLLAGYFGVHVKLAGSWELGVGYSIPS